jgi:hypothetical protein
MRTVVVENSNFIPTKHAEYEQRVKRRTQAHCIGRVTRKEYCGLLESLSNLSASQMPF